MTDRAEQAAQATGEMNHQETISDEAFLPQAEFDFFIVEDASEATLREAAETHQGKGIPLTPEELQYLQISRPSLFEKPTPEQLEELGLNEATYNEMLRADLGMRVFEVSRKLDFDVVRKGNNSMADVRELHGDLHAIQYRMMEQEMLDAIPSLPDGVETPFEYAQWCKAQVMEVARKITSAPERAEPMLQLEGHPSSERLQKIFGERMEVGILYGSAVYDENSQDYDCLVIVDSLDPEYLEEVSRRSALDQEENVEKKMSYLLVDRESAAAMFEADPISVMFRKEGAQVFGEGAYEFPIFGNDILKRTVKEGQGLMEMRQHLMDAFSEEGMDRNASKEYRMRKTPWRVATTLLQVSRGKIVSAAEVGKVLYEAGFEGYEQKPRTEFGEDYEDLKDGVVKYNSQMGMIAQLGMQAIAEKVAGGEGLFDEMEATKIETYDFDALSEAISAPLLEDIASSMFEDTAKGIAHFSEVVKKYPRFIVCTTGNEIAGVVAFSQPIETAEFGTVQSVKITYSKTTNEEQVLMEMGGAMRRELTNNGTDSVIESNPRAIYVRERLGFRPVSIEYIRNLATELDLSVSNLTESEGGMPIYEDENGAPKSLYMYKHHIRKV